MARKYDHIVLDFDGTIVDSISLLLPLVEIYAEKYGVHEDIHWEELRDKPVHVILDYFGMNIFEKVFLQIKIQRYMRSHFSDLVMFPGMQDILESADETRRVSIISSNSRSLIKGYLEFNGVKFSGDIIGGSVVIPKQWNINRLKRRYSSDRYLYIGDELKDHTASKAAGVDFIAVSWGFNTKESFEDRGVKMIADSADDLKRFVG